MTTDTKTAQPRLYQNPRYEAEIAEVEKEMMGQMPAGTVEPEKSQATQQSKADATPEADPSVFEKRYRDLKKYHDEQIFKERKARRELEKKAESAITPPKTEEEMSKFKEQYPEFFDAMLTMTHNGSAKATSVLEQELADVRAQLDNVKAEKAVKEIEKAHPDYANVLSSEGFKSWLEVQDPTIQSWVNEENTTDARSFNNALDLYKVQTGVSAQQKSSDKSTKSKPKGSAADAVKTRGAPVDVGNSNERIWSVQEIKDMPMEVFDQYMDEITTAQREGRVR